MQFDGVAEAVEEKIQCRIEGWEMVLSNEGGIEKMELGKVLLIRNALEAQERALWIRSELVEQEMELSIHSALEQEKAPLIHSRQYSVTELAVYCHKRS